MIPQSVNWTKVIELLKKGPSLVDDPKNHFTNIIFWWG